MGQSPMGYEPESGSVTNLKRYTLSLSFHDKKIPVSDFSNSPSQYMSTNFTMTGNFILSPCSAIMGK